MGNQEIVRLLWRPFQNVLTKKVNTRKRLRTCSADAHARELEHRVTRIDAIDIDPRIDAQELAKETAVAFAEDQRALRPGNFVDPVRPGMLQRISENNCLYPAIVWRNKIEIHSKRSADNNSIGVNRTRSASAVRSSRETGTKYSAPNRSPLVPRHNAIGQSTKSNTTRSAHPTSKIGKRARASRFTSGQSVAISVGLGYDQDSFPIWQC